MFQRKQQDTDQCPRCGEPNEDQNHVFQCKGPGTTIAFNTGLAELSHWLSKSTSQGISTAIIALLTSIRNNDQDYETPEDTNPLIAIAIQKQLSLGDASTPSGLLCVQWKPAQEDYHRRVGSRKSAQKWVATLATKLIELTYNMWKHRNDILHNNDNVIRDQEHQTLNDHIEYIYTDLPRSLRFFSHAEQRFFRKSDKQNLKK